MFLRKPGGVSTRSGSAGAASSLGKASSKPPVRRATKPATKPGGAGGGGATGANGSATEDPGAGDGRLDPAADTAGPGSGDGIDANGEYRLDGGASADGKAGTDAASGEPGAATDSEEAAATEEAAEPAPEPEPETNERWRFYRDGVERLYPGTFNAKANGFNVIGVLGFLDGDVVPNTPGVFNDTIALAWKDAKGNEKCLELKASCDPGGRESNKQEIHLWSGQYKFKAGSVRDTVGAYDAFLPAGPVTVFFDSNGDGRFHPHDELKTGSFPQIFLGAAPGPADTLLPGGQLIAGGRGPGTPWQRFFDALSQASGPFTYTLTEGDTLVDPIGDAEAGAKAGRVEIVSEPAPTDPKKGIPSGPNPNKPQENPPKLVGNVPMAPSTGLYWPVIPKKGKPDKTVFYLGEKKKNGWGSRHFGAPRTDGGPRSHAGIDIVGALGDTVVACEPGVIVNWYHFYRGVYAIIVQNDSGTVINYGEVDERSKKQYGWNKGDRVAAGQPIGFVGKMYVDSMLHFEMFVEGTKSNVRWEAKPHPKLLNPTQYLLDLAAYTDG